MSFINTITNADIKDISLLFRIALDRVPILIHSENSEKVEDLIDGIANLLSFRNKIIFYNDFTTKNDYDELMNNEEIDYWVERNLYISYPYSIEKMIPEINDFYSWIIGYTENPLNEDFQELINNLKDKLYLKSDFYLDLKISDEYLELNLIGNSIRNFNINFEKWIYENSIRRTEKSIEKMKRIISKGVRNPDFEQQELEELMNFSIEGEQLKENIIIKEFNNFYEASKRAFNVLNRMKIIESLGFQTSLSKRTLASIIAYKFASISRILDFIYAEWNLDFKDFLNPKKITNFTDTFESLWG